MITRQQAKDWRKEMRLTQRQVAECLGVTPVTYGNWERGTNPSMLYDSMVKLEALITNANAGTMRYLTVARLILARREMRTTAITVSTM